MPDISRQVSISRALKKFWQLSLMLCLFPTSIASSQNLPNKSPKLYIDYWIKNYQQVNEGQKYDIAQRVFDKIRHVADNPAGNVFSLYIFADLPLTHIFALHDGSIVLPVKVIEFCLQDRSSGEARLAFVLGHEIKHLAMRDYWFLDHIIQFFENINTDANLSRLMEVVQWDFQDRTRKKIETEADKYGILYASLAGYDVDAIFSFIPEYYRAAGINIHDDVTNNSVSERIRAVEGRLTDAIEHLPLFDFGVMLYAIGQYDAAIECLSRFVQYYPSREVFNNLGLCFYQKALSLYAKWKPDDVATNPNFIFKLAPQIDPVSRIRGIRRRGLENKYEQQLSQALSLCLENLEKAKNLDPGYEVSYSNLGCAYLLRGEVEFAIGNLKRAIKLNPSYKEAYNNVGVCYAVEGDAEAAKNSFLDASRISLTYSDPVFNLGQLYRLAGRNEEAASHYRRYLELDASGKYANMVRDYLGIRLSTTPLPDFKEVILDRSPGHIHINFFTEREPVRTSKAELRIHVPREKGVRYFHYRSVQEELKIFIIEVGENYKGHTKKEINIGDPDQVVEQRYPYPRRNIPSTKGEFWVFDEIGLVFQMRDGKVRGWFLFDIL
ncbi:MAG: tetratricopeptide repeat protein [bacterium]